MAPVSLRLAGASVAVGVLVLVAVWLTDLSIERAVLLAPVLVIGVAVAAGLVVFWVRVGWDSLRKSKRPRLYVALGIAFVGLMAVLSALGVKLPRE